jgi:hypothetical protein
MDGEMVSDRNVKEFVRKTLGCDCAEDVFKHIENEHDVDMAGIRLRNKIDVGNRLLVYVSDAGDLSKEMPALVKAGREERDARGFNRFRLVLVSDDAALRERAFKAFARLPEVDEKVHLHVIGKAGAGAL